MKNNIYIYESYRATKTSKALLPLVTLSDVLWRGLGREGWEIVREYSPINTFSHKTPSSSLTPTTSTFLHSWINLSTTSPASTFFNSLSIRHICAQPSATSSSSVKHVSLQFVGFHPPHTIIPSTAGWENASLITSSSSIPCFQQTKKKIKWTYLFNIPTNNYISFRINWFKFHKLFMNSVFKHQLILRSIKFNINLRHIHIYCWRGCV